ncbi:hypothetical protein ACIHAA_06755 [Streptomyces sp. NPDC052040]
MPTDTVRETGITDREFASVRSTIMDANPDMPEEMAARIVDEG